MSEKHKLARDRILSRDPDYFKRIGAKGGKASGTGGFWYAKFVVGDIERIRAAGRKGGRLRWRKDAA